MARHQLHQRSTEIHTRQAAKSVDLTSASTSGRAWLAALLAALGTFIFVWLLSPGLRSDLGQVALFLSALDAADIRDWILSFGAFSAVVYFLVVVAQVIISPIPAGPVTFAGHDLRCAVGTRPEHGGLGGRLGAGLRGGE